MGRKTTRIDARKLEGFKYFRMIDDLLERLRPVGCERDRAGNRDLYFDQYAVLMLLYFFNPTVTSLRGLRKFTSLKKVQKLCGVQETSLGSLSEAARVFDPGALEPIIAELGQRAALTKEAMPAASEAALSGLVAVDGSLLPALPKMAWALWQDSTHRAAKLHVAFGVFEGVPRQASVTAGNDSERTELRQMVEPGGFYVADRGYADYSMFRDFDELGCRFVIRVQQNAVFEIDRENELTDEDRAAGVVRDVILRRLGTEKHNSLLERPLRIVITQHEESGDRWILATNALDLSAQLVSVAYHYRWQVELFFRWLKCVLGCRHLLSESQQGVTLQIYFAVIAALLIGLWVGRKPSKRTWEMLCHYLSGWATIDELDQHLAHAKKQGKPPPSNS